jgi:hypothetical protein
MNNYAVVAIMGNGKEEIFYPRCNSWENALWETSNLKAVSHCTKVYMLDTDVRIRMRLLWDKGRVIPQTY